jgi:large subunit ribosomal protein L19
MADIIIERGTDKNKRIFLKKRLIFCGSCARIHWSVKRMVLCRSRHEGAAAFPCGMNVLNLKEDTIMDLMKALTSQYMKQELPEVQVGDTVRVHVKIKEGSRERIQIFEGTVIAKKHGGIEESITVRRISYGVGCEKVFPIHAPNVVDVECVRHGKVRRAKLYYLRDRLGKAAKVKEKV